MLANRQCCRGVRSRSLRASRITAASSIAYFVTYAKTLGYIVTVTAFASFRAGQSRAGQPTGTQDCFFIWQINAPLNTITYFAVGQSYAGQQLASWGNAVLQCELMSSKPAHTYLNFGNPASGVAATIVDADWLNMIQQELVIVAIGGSQTPSKTTYNQGLLAIQQMIAGRAPGVVGMVRNASMSVTAASAAATFNADQIVVGTSLTGLQYFLGSFSKTINLATTGAGGMDAGSAPPSGFVALYAIYNPTTQTAALLATNETSAVAPNVYGAKHAKWVYGERAGCSCAYKFEQPVPDLLRARSARLHRSGSCIHIYRQSLFIYVGLAIFGRAEECSSSSG